jgi:hypothetical protein
LEVSTIQLGPSHVLVAELEEWRGLGTEGIDDRDIAAFEGN